MIGRRERNKLYLELWDAFHREGCPVCTCVDAATIGQVRAALDRASGQQGPRLCIAHTARMAAGDDGYGCTAVLGFIRDAGEWLRAQIDRARHRSDARALVDRLRRVADRHPAGGPSSDCMACRAERARENLILAFLPEALTDPDFDRSFRESDGLCFHHLFLLSRLTPSKPTVTAVLQTQLRKIEDLRDAIAPHRFQPERMGPPADPAAWERARRLLRRPPADPGAEGGEPLAGADAAPDCLAEAARAGETEAGGDPAVDADGFEKEKWRRSRAMLQEQLQRESSRAAALHYRYFKALEDNRTLQMHLAGAQAQARSLEEQVARLKEELLSCRSQSGSRRESDSGR